MKLCDIKNKPKKSKLPQDNKTFIIPSATIRSNNKTVNLYFCKYIFFSGTREQEEI